ncbi:hypothetical protein DV736_g4619, partial [Chaetothyriales sp. CBS 134916]
MPAPFTSTFASAAASTNGDSSAKRDQPGAGDWSRNRPNGATHTFRRPSANTTSTTSVQQPRDSPFSAAVAPSTAAPSTTGVYIPPHLNSSHPSYRNGLAADTRYTKEQLLDVFQAQKDSGQLASRVADSFVGAWDPLSDKNGLSALPSRSDRDQFLGPEVCWRYSSSPPLPLGLVDMTDDEKQLFAASVNSPLKMPQNSKDGAAGAPLGTARKLSVSGFSAASSNLSRPGTRRRDTSDSFTANPPLSPAEAKSFFQTSATATPPPALLRRRTDYKEDDEAGSSQKEAGKEEATSLTNPSHTAPPAALWPAGSGSGSGSRFKDLLAKTSTEDMASVSKEKSAFSGLEKLPEEDALGGQSRIHDMFKTRPARSETNPYDDGPARSASAALSASQDGRSSAQGPDPPGFPLYSAPRDFGTDSTVNPAPSRYPSANEPLSPAHTNPFHSPHGLRHDEDDPSISDPTSQQALPPFSAGRRSLFNAESASRGFGGLPGFGPWSSAGLGLGTPARDRNMASSAIGDQLFSPGSDMQSPSAGVGAAFFGSSSSAFGAHGRSARLGPMFPPAMQEQMRGEPRTDPQAQPFSSRPQSAQQDLASRDPFEASFARGVGVGAVFGGLDEANPRANEAAPGFAAPGIGVAPQQPPIRAQSAHQRASTGSDLDQGQLTQDGQLPAAQQRQMVMPDRMRWIYRDPQGTIQGPWSGLEMHDWFKAGFFTAELLVKKVEDADFEPLAQLVRRIGNSREPFLVPQIGVPHGPAASSSPNWPNPASSVAGSAQPPFASAFPSFGTTLTAEQQNALERRKQEEQYLMARQKEHLAQQQVYMRQQHQIQNGPHGLPSALQHHSSTQSLHSQPSFGSIASPNAGPFPASTNAPIAALHQPITAHSTSAAALPPYGRDDELPTFLERLNFNQRINLTPGTGPLGAPAETTPGLAQMLQDRARLQQQQQLQHHSEIRSHQEAFLGPQGRNSRLDEFNELRGQADAAHSGPEPALPPPIRAPRTLDEPQQTQAGPIGHLLSVAQKPGLDQDQKTTLTEQIQRQAEWKEHQPVQPPPASISPLPAPAAQRNRTHVADSLVPEPGSGTHTPVEAPSASIAPWAQQPVESVTKGPSLKEIQEAEAKKAAQQEAIAAEARRIQAEHERITTTSIPSPGPGLPATSIWGQSTSPGIPNGPVSNAWAKSSAKPTSTTTTAKKTLAQIQKEEEARKQRQAAALGASNAQAGVGSPTSAVQGKRYAELASKAGPTPSSTNLGGAGGAWTTVGSSGKAKLPPPNTIVATPQPAGSNRSVSSMTSSLASAAAAKRPALTSTKSSASVTGSTEKTKADEEFRRWLRSQLSKGLSPGIDVDVFMENLSSLPLEVGLIADAVYGASQTLDGRRVAEEFVRRKKLADKGMVEAVSNGSALETIAKSQGGGWSEVAKKGPVSDQKQETGRREEFKVVAGKKKAKR